MSTENLNVTAWLESLGLGQYASAFSANDIAADLLADLTADDLKELGVTSLGHRKRLLAAIRELAGDRGDALEGAPAIAPGAYTPAYLAERILQSRHTLEGEIKQVTILFVDIKESTQMVAALSAEEASRRIYPALRKMMTAVHRYEGTVNKLQGDGLMAIFGAPLAHEDHAVRACYAALAIRQAIAGSPGDEPADPIEIRIGLHSGEVLVRTINNDLSMSYDAIGITVHLAARMEQLADANSIRLTAETAHLADGFVELKPLGLKQVKGLEEPVAVFDLLGATGARTRWQTSLSRGLSPFVGRETEMAALRSALARAGTGRGRLVALAGEAGIGKSRLTYEFTREALEAGWQVLAASSVSYGQATTWLPVIGLLRGYFNLGDMDEKTAVIEKVRSRLRRLDESLVGEAPALLALFDIDVDEPGWQALGNLQRRRRTLNALQTLFIRESQRQPLLLIFEDLHWIDGETQALLDELAEQLPDNRILLLVNYRPYYQDAWRDLEVTLPLRLEPLVQDNTVALLDKLLGDDRDLDSLKETLRQRAEGSPLFLEESVRTLRDSGALLGRQGAYRLGRTGAAIELPDTIQAIIAARIDRLDPAEKQLLQMASVIGTTVPLTLLQTIAGQDDDRLAQGLDALQTAEFLFITQSFPEVEYAFRHAHTHQVAYEGLLQEQRKQLHARIGRAMHDLYPERRLELVEKLAEHFEKGEVWEEAIRLYTLAALKAKEKYAYEVASEYAHKVLALAGHAPGEHQSAEADALTLLGDVASLVDDLDAANTLYAQALRHAPDEMRRQIIAGRVHERHFVYRDGGKIAYYSHGRGDRILVLATPIGYIQSTIQPIVERLSQEFRIITYDNRGIGASDPLPAEYPFRSHIADLRAVIEALDGPPVELLGLSQSAATVARLAWRHPALVSKLVLVGASARLPRTVNPDTEEDRRYWRAIHAGDFSLHDAYLVKFINDRIPEPESRDLAQRMHGMFQSIPHDVWHNFVFPDRDKDVRPVIAEVRTPTLLMYGTLELTLDYEETADYFLRTMPDAQLYVFQDKGHLPLFTAQQEFCDVLRTFVLTGKVPEAR